jgi:hypothetical protein
MEGRNKNEGYVMRVRFAAVAVFCSLAFAMISAQSQTQSGKVEGTPAATQSAIHPKPKNLKVLPKDMSGDDVDKLMHQYQQYLGVPCGYCHEENPETKQINYVSDENPSKEVARFMISMTSDINSKYLSQLGDRRYADPITCGNCHRGQVQPPAFELKSHQ